MQSKESLHETLLIIRTSVILSKAKGKRNVNKQERACHHHRGLAPHLLVNLDRNPYQPYRRFRHSFPHTLSHSPTSHPCNPRRANRFTFRRGLIHLTTYWRRIDRPLWPPPGYADEFLYHTHLHDRARLGTHLY